MEMIKLENVIDIRTGMYYSVVRVKQRNARWFVQVENEDTTD